jgi:activator of 2-hydroxyglutaryl-CoA dehydratase
MVSGMAEALGSALQEEVTVAPQPQTTGALGAALLAVRQLRGQRSVPSPSGRRLG